MTSRRNSNMTKPIYIDGSLGEGGGQILRTSLALAALLRQPVQIDNIRANRRQPGLKTQHLAGVLALAKITAAEVQGAHKHSTSLSMVPRTITGGKYQFEISTAGAATMLLGATLPALLFAPQSSEITVTGGTHVPFSPQFHYLDRVFVPTLNKMGAKVTLELKRWGFYPKGGGKIRAYVTPCHSLQGLRLAKRGKLQSLQLLACSSADLPGHIARREIAQVEMSLADHIDILSAKALTCQALSPGNIVFLEAIYENCKAGFSGLGKKGRPAEEVAEEACLAFRDFDKTEATVDSHLADQIILYLALAQNNSFFITEKVTSHLLTNMQIIHKFLPATIEAHEISGHVHVTGTGKSQLLKQKKQYER